MASFSRNFFLKSNAFRRLPKVVGVDNDPFITTYENYKLAELTLKYAFKYI